jgi:LruC domain-containing protein
MLSNKIILAVIVALQIGAWSCRKDDSSQNNVNQSKFEDLKISPDFNFETSEERTFEITALDNLDSPIQSVRFDIYTAHPDSGGVLVTSGATNSQGIFAGKISLPSLSESIVITTRYLGFPFENNISLSGNTITAVYGGSQKSLNIKSSSMPFKSSLKSISGVPIVYMGTFNNMGVPNYLEPVNDPITQEFLNDVNASLPEKRPVPQYNPEYLDHDNQTSISITQESDVWITFVHEGAGYKNVLGFYTYDVNNPPATVNNISSISIIYPNVSFQGSGGGLISGNKVLLGRFPANVKIGWALLQNAFNGTVNPNAPIFYSDSWLNPETNSNIKQHTVQLLDPGRDLVIMSFEDQRRDGSCDNDFNDAIFYVTANPVEAIEYSDMPVITYVNPDTDQDGISDNFDEFPNDPEKAFISYFPGQNSYGTLAYEDLWPDMGDYDFNDLVVKYRFSQITNGNNDVVQINSAIIPAAIGANLKTGLGFQFDGIPPSAIESVTGSVLTEHVITLSSNGTESGQSKAVFIAFDKAFSLFSDITGVNPGGMSAINTYPGGRTGTPEVVSMEINFVNPVNASSVGLAPFNPFLFYSKNRGHEIHLPDYTPTDQADASYFGTESDDSNPGTGRYYKSDNNLPWALNVVDLYDYTIEEVPINSAFVYFNNWAVSSGVQNKDWYKNMSGYRVNQNIY